jgi:hypothetical protein
MKTVPGNSLFLILRKQKIGLWSMANPIPPWVYRQKHRKVFIR